MAPEPVVRLEAVSKTYAGGIIGARDVNLDIAPGEFLTLLGPSGCGKTTTLRMIAGFEAPTGGRILIDGRDVTHAAPYDRPVNTVFQDYALFPHMTVADNVGFGLSVARMARGEIARKVAGALDLVGLGDKAGARTTALSGGQRQRVALARALVCEPRVLLLDEPLAALDAHLREQMQVELKRLQSRLGTTFVMVTHDQTEALSISDRIVVMNKGAVEQVASPATLYDTPATRFVASFIGAMNLVEARAVARQDGLVEVAIGPLHLRAVDTAPDASNLVIAVRPEDVEIGAGDAARVTGSVFHGRAIRLQLSLAGGGIVMADVPRQNAAFGIGATVGLNIRDGAARAFAA